MVTGAPGRWPGSNRRAPLLAGLAVLVVAVSSIAAGAWWGFPVQDDTYMIRLLRMGGPNLILAEHPDRPIAGFLIGSCARIAGESRPLYIAVGLLFWCALAAEGAGLWIRLFPGWSRAWPAVALAVVAPVISQVQFTTLTTVVPCVLPVVLVLAAMLTVLRGADAGMGTGARIAAVVLCACAGAVSEYSLAAVSGAATYLFLRARWRGGLTLGAGVGIGYVVYRALGHMAARATTDPDVQLEVLVRNGWSVPLRILSAAWTCIVGSWGVAVSELRIEWSSKSTLVAAVVALALAACVAAVRVDRGSPDAPERGAGNLLALVAAVIVGLVPAFVLREFPLRRIYETRFFVPVLVFASCSTLAGLLYLSRPRLRALVVLSIVLICADRLVIRAVEEKRLKWGLERIGQDLRPLVGDAAGLVVVVVPARFAMSPEETMTKVTYAWGFPQAGRLWMMGAEEAKGLFGPRAGCRSATTLDMGPQVIRWPRADEPVRLVLWDASHTEQPDLEPYYRGCVAR